MRKASKNRNWILLAVSSVLLLIWITFGNLAGPGGLPIPAMGDFLNPSTGFWQNTRFHLIDRTDSVTVALGDPVGRGDVYFDDRGIPHIFADDLEGALFLLGYMHATDRLWQMDISTRATEGRLSEVLGERTVNRDRQQIRQGFRYVARNTVDTLRDQFPEDLALLEAYANGVNAFIDRLRPEDYPVEYKLLNHEPLRWSPYRSILFMKGMSQSLSGFYQDVEAGITKAYAGDEQFKDLFPEWFPYDSPVVPTDKKKKEERSAASQPERGKTPAVIGGVAPARRRQITESLAAGLPGSNYRPPSPDSLPFSYDPANGSNNWAVGSERSNTRHPMLANDPHLRLSLPSIWYEVQIRFPGCNVRGVSLPGAPGILMGFNDFIAWGETNVGHDVTDWFRVDWIDEERTRYRLDGRETAATLVKDTLRVRGQADEVITTPWTIFGPVPEREGPYADLAMRWLAHLEPGRDSRSHSGAVTFIQLMEARGYEDYLAAIRGHVDPAQNFLMAAKDGTIAIRPNGFFPLRGKGQSGRFVSPGDSSHYNWRGYLPFEQRPEHRNPPRGYVSSANQQTTDANFPYPYVGRFDEYRGRLINRELARQPVMNQRQMKELQLSTHSLYAEEVTPLLIARINRNRLTEEGQQLLRIISEWDYRYEGESRAPTVFERWSAAVYQLTFDEFPGSELYLQPEKWKFTELLRRRPDHPIFDDKTTENFRETAATLTQRAFEELLEELNGAAPPRWYVERDADIDHLGQIPGFGSELIRTGGGRLSPRVVADGFGASWRMVVETGVTPRAWGTLPGGPSGNPASPFYDSDLDDWIDGRYHELQRYDDPGEARLKATTIWKFR